jgi:hypothetical protein
MHTRRCISSKPFLVHCKVDKWEGKQVEGNAKQGRRAPSSDHCLYQCHLARCDVAEMKGSGMVRSKALGKGKMVRPRERNGVGLHIRRFVKMTANIPAEWVSADMLQ